MSPGSAATPGLVSVVMPFFDTPEPFMAQAIESVQRQSYGRWELILLDDGSSAGSSDLARTLAGRGDGRIRYLEHVGHRNLGSSASRNAAVAHARGKYIAFLDADDVWLEHKLTDQMEILERHPDVAMLYGSTCYWHSWNPSDRRRDFEPSLGLSTPQVVQPPTLLKLSLQGRIAVPCTSSIVVRRAALGCGDWFENEFPGLYDDQVFYAKIWARHAVYVSGQCWDRYRQHGGSMTHREDHPAPHQRARLAYLCWLERYLADLGVADVGLQRALLAETRVLCGGRLARLEHRLRRLARTALDGLRERA